MTGMRVVKISGKNVTVLGRLPPGVYATPEGRILITKTSCTAPEQAYLADFDISGFTLCFSHGIVIEGEVSVGESVERVGEICGAVSCSYKEIDNILFRRRHVAIIGGTGSGKTTLIIRHIEQTPPENGRVVVLAYHSDLLELSRLPHVKVVRPRVDICDLDYQSLFMLLQFHRLSAEPVKMQRYLRMLLPAACEASRQLGVPSHEALILLLRLLTMIETIESKCKAQPLVGNSSESLYCKLRQVLEDHLGRFKYNVVKDLARGRDADSLNSLLMYAEMAFASDFTGRTEIISDAPVTLVDLTPALSLITGHIEGRLASLLSILFAQRASGGVGNAQPLYVVVDEFAALSSVEYVHNVFKLLLMQGRKFGIFLIAAGQPDASIYDLLPNFHVVILGRIAGSRAIGQLATGLPNVPTAVLRVLPVLKPLEMIMTEEDRITPFRVLQPSWRI